MLPFPWGFDDRICRRLPSTHSTPPSKTWCMKLEQFLGSLNSHTEEIPPSHRYKECLKATGWDRRVGALSVLHHSKSRGFSAQFSSPMMRKIIKFVGHACVNDTDQVETEKMEGEHHSNILTCMQTAVDTWEEGIKAAGGAICPEKCHWCLLEFLWDGSTWKLATSSNSPGILTVRDSEGQRKIIARKEPHESEVTLGVHCSPDGNMQHQAERMLAQSTSWGDKISAGKLHRIALRTTIWKTLGCPLSATLLSKSECESTMRPALNAALPRMGIDQHFPHKLTMPLFLQSKFPCLEWVLTNASLANSFLPPKNTKVCQFLIHTRHKMLRIFGTSFAINCVRISLQLFIKAPLKHCSYLLGWAPNSCCVQSRELMQTSLKRLPLAQEISVSPTQQNYALIDTLTMPLFLQSKFSDYERQIVNRCHVCLNPLSVAELTSGDSHEVSSSVWNGHIATDSLHDFQWPYQARAPGSEWTIWRQCPAQALCNLHGKLHRRLGDWTRTPTTYWLCDPSDQSL